MTDVQDAISRAHRDEWARLVAILARRYRSLDIAEDAAGEAFAAAVDRWPTDGVPANPAAWLTTTANRKAIDRMRRESTRDARHREALLVFDDMPASPVGVIDDERLRLIFVCCHPALATEARIALTLRMLGGLTVVEIARAFLVQEGAIARRITRAKTKIAEAGIPFRVPTEADLAVRLDGVLTVLYLVFNEGYLATGATDEPIRDELVDEAIRLARLLRELLPDEGEVTGLLALMLLIRARRAARVSAGGDLMPIDRQDRRLWDTLAIDEGHALVRERLATGIRPGRYQLLAAINAVHTSAAEFAETDWSQIVALYNQLAVVDPSPIVALNRAVAIAEVDGPDVGLALVDRLAAALAEYGEFHAARADLLRRLGREVESRAEYDRAIALTTNAAEAAYLESRRG